MYLTVLSSLSDPNGAKNEKKQRPDAHGRKYVNPFSEALHQDVPDYKSLGIFVTDPIQPPKADIWTPYRGKPIDVIAELKRRGIDLSKPSSQWDTNVQFQSFLDIKYFEDTMISPLPPQKMLGLLKDLPPQAFRFYKNVVMLEYVTDIAYQEQTNMYNVRFKDNKTFVISPLFVLFPFEDPMAFVDRIERAFALRRVEESWFRYWLYIKNIPSDDLQSLTQTDKTRLLNTITRSPKFAAFARSGEKYEFSQKILDEIDQQMKMVSNSIIFNMKVLSNPLLYRGLDLPLPRLPGAMEDIPAPPDADAQLAMKEKIKAIQNIHLFTNDWFVNSTPIIVSWCLDISNSCLFNTICPPALPLEQWSMHHLNFEKKLISK